MDELIEKLSDQTAKRTATPDDAELLISLMEQERLGAVIADAYTYAALEYSFVGNKERARMYAALSVEVGTLYGGPKGEDVIWMKRLWDKPEEHWSWLYFIRNGTNSVTTTTAA